VGFERLVRLCKHLYVWQGSLRTIYEPEWSPIRELVAAAVTYSQSRCVTDTANALCIVVCVKRHVFKLVSKYSCYNNNLLNRK